MTYLCGLVSAVMFKLALYTFESVLDLFGNSECLVKGFHLEPNRMMYFSYSFMYLLIDNLIITIIVIFFFCYYYNYHYYYYYADDGNDATNVTILLIYFRNMIMGS